MTELENLHPEKQKLHSDVLQTLKEKDYPNQVLGLWNAAPYLLDAVDAMLSLLIESGVVNPLEEVPPELKRAIEKMEEYSTPFDLDNNVVQLYEKEK